MFRSTDEMLQRLSSEAWGQRIAEDYRLKNYKAITDVARYFPDTEEKHYIEVISSVQIASVSNAARALKELKSKVGNPKIVLGQVGHIIGDHFDLPQMITQSLQQKEVELGCDLTRICLLKKTKPQAVLPVLSQVLLEASKLDNTKVVIDELYQGYVELEGNDRNLDFGANLCRQEGLYRYGLDYLSKFKSDSSFSHKQVSGILVPLIGKVPHYRQICNDLVRLDETALPAAALEVHNRFKRKREADARDALQYILDQPYFLLPANINTVASLFETIDIRMLRKNPRLVDHVINASLTAEQWQRLLKNISKHRADDALPFIDKAWPVFDLAMRRSVAYDLYRQAKRTEYDWSSGTYFFLLSRAFQTVSDAVAYFSLNDLSQIIFTEPHIPDDSVFGDKVKIVQVLIEKGSGRELLDAMARYETQISDADFEKYIAMLAEKQPDLFRENTARIPFFFEEGKRLIISKYLPKGSDIKTTYRNDVVLYSLPNLMVDDITADREVKVFRGTSNLPSTQSETAPSYSQFVIINFPAVSEMDRKMDLVFQLSKQKLEGTLSDEIVFEGVEDEEIDLYIALTAPGFALQAKDSARNVKYRLGRHYSTTFTLFPAESGLQHVEVEVFQLKGERSRRVGYYTVSTFVRQPGVPEQVVPAESNTVTLEKIEQRINKIAPHHYTLEVREEPGTLIYTLLGEESEKPFSLTHDEIMAELKSFNATLAACVQADAQDNDEWENIVTTLSAHAKNFTDKLLPETLLTKTAAIPTGATISISTTLQWIPWELVHDHVGFWGERFIVSRYPRVGKACGPSENREVKETGEPLPVKGTLNIVGGEIPRDSADRAVSLFDKKPLTVQVLEKRTFVDLNKSLPNHNLLHFTCHGHTQPQQMLQIYSDQSIIYNLVANKVAEMKIDPGFMVFANACSSSAPVVNFGEFITFGCEFYKKGALTFIGTLGLIPVERALTFADTVYELLFKDHSLTIGEALKQAREKAKGERNIFWLLYTLYGEPHLKMNFQPEERANNQPVG